MKDLSQLSLTLIDNSTPILISMFHPSLGRPLSHSTVIKTTNKTPKLLPSRFVAVRRFPSPDSFVSYSFRAHFKLVSCNAILLFCKILLYYLIPGLQSWVDCSFSLECESARNVSCSQRAEMVECGQTSAQCSGRKAHQVPLQLGCALVEEFPDQSSSWMLVELNHLLVPHI